MVRVKHPRYGEGEALEARYAGYERLVRFGKGILRWLRQKDLIAISQDPFGPSEPEIPLPVSPIPATTPVSPERGEAQEAPFGKKPGSPLPEDPFALPPEAPTGEPEIPEPGSPPTSPQPASPELPKDPEQPSQKRPGSSSPLNPFTLPIEVPTTAPKVQGPDSTPQQNARKMIEAFRLGIVPHSCVENFTFGREAELRAIAEFLDSDEDGVLLLIGEYGAGKTHFLYHASDFARKRGYAVSVVETDPSEVSFNRPKRVYRQIVKNLKSLRPGNDVPIGFRQFVLDAAAKGGFKDHHYLKYIHGSESNDLFWQWIEADTSTPRPYIIEQTQHCWYVQPRQDLPPLYDHAKAANIYTNILSGLSSAAHNYLGCRGLLILFDESESAVTAETFYRQEMALNFLRALTKVAENADGIDNHPEATGLSFSRMGGRQGVPFAHQIRSHLKIVFAITPGCEYLLPYDLRCCSRLELDSLSTKTLSEVFRSIVQLYGKAYGLTRLPASNKELIKRYSYITDTTRRFVKGSVEIADIARIKLENKVNGNPGRSPSPDR